MKTTDYKKGMLVRVIDKTIHGRNATGGTLYPAHKRGWGYVTKSDNYGVFMTETPGGMSEPGAYSPNDLEIVEYLQVKCLSREALLEAAIKNEPMGDYLEDIGLIERVPEPEEITYSMGDRFRYEGREDYLLARVGVGMVALISLSDGNLWSGPVAVNSASNISQAVIDVMIGQYPFTKIEGE